MYALNPTHSPENESFWESADCVHLHAGHGQVALLESILSVPGVSDSIETNNDSGAILACNRLLLKVGMNVQRNRRHSNGLLHWDGNRFSNETINSR